MPHATRGYKALLLTLAMTAALVGLAAFVLPGQDVRLMAEHLRNQLDTVPDDRAEGLLRQAAELGEPGIPVLVDALASKRPIIARSGGRLLDEQLGLWQTLDVAARSARLAVLARALAARVDRFDPDARREAARLAARILARPLDSGTIDRRRVVACCERVFRADAAGPDLPGEDAQLPGASETLEPAPADLAAEPAAERGAGDVGIETPRRLTVASPARPLEPVGETQSATVSAWPGEAGDGPRAAADAASNANRVVTLSLSLPEAPWPGGLPDGLSAGPPEPVNPPADEPVATAAGEPVAAETVHLMQRLGSPDGSTASQARDELVRRGFTEVHLELARRLFDPDPEVRRQLARVLPAIGSVDATAWLLWLSRDPDAEVRLAAIGLMATTGDARLLEQVERAARDDADPRIRRQAELIAGRRSGASETGPTRH